MTMDIIEQNVSLRKIYVPILFHTIQRQRRLHHDCYVALNNCDFPICMLAIWFEKRESNAHPHPTFIILFPTIAASLAMWYTTTSGAAAAAARHL